ncbi:MAG: exonuclease subunit SbcD [Aquificaceae bacterium]|nr:exonuclease subunit SbcD [Aquificaceae bacterium]MDW8423680.1 exonuclease subunit SbcD [Aquificaceae bacterium]
MRILHISDLHAGKRLYDRISRLEDLIYALEQVKTICKEESVEIVLIAGDIFDKRNPDYESQNVIMEFLTELNALEVHTLLIAGNHDSYDFMKIYKNLRKLAKIHVFDRPAKDPAEAIFHYKDLKVACLPYPDERVITHFHEERERSYADKVAKYMKALAREVEDARYKILMAHLMLDKAQIAGSELPSSVSPYYSVRTDAIPETFSYVALGHVHKNQKVEGAVPKVYYSGSPYQIDFSEKGTDKFLNLLVLEDGLVRVERIRLDLKRQLVEITIKETDNIQAVLKPAAEKNVLVKVCLQVRMGDPYYNIKRDLVSKLLGEKLAKLDIEPIGNSQPLETKGNSFDLVELYGEFYREKYRSEPPEELRATLKRLIDKVGIEHHS